MTSTVRYPERKVVPVSPALCIASMASMAMSLTSNKNISNKSPPNSHPASISTGTGISGEAMLPEKMRLRRWYCAIRKMKAAMSHFQTVPTGRGGTNRMMTYRPMRVATR